MNRRCPICKGQLFTPVKSLFDFPNVVSDCRPYRAGRSVADCLRCGMFCRVVETGYSFGDVYENYSVLSHGGDQMNFDGAMQGRTQKILSALSLNNINTVLDIGSGNGAGLRELQKLYPDAVGYDPHGTGEGVLRDPLEGQYDLITMFHVLEHIEDLDGILAFIKKSLATGGRLLIQVPYAPEWPFDFIIADHLWHFTMKSLTMLMQENGFEVISINNDIIKKEITCVAWAQKEPFKWFTSHYENTNMFYALRWLQGFKQRLDEIREPVAVYGSAPAAAWAAHILGGWAIAHIDDNPELIGSTLNGRKILSSVNDSFSVAVVAPFFGHQLEAIRTKSPHLRFL